MRFLLEPGDAVAARHCAPGELRAGDVALLVKWAAGMPAGYVLHRVLLNLSAVGGPVLTRGDANLLPDWPPSAFQPAGRASALLRCGSRYELSGGPWASFLLPLYSLAANKALYFTAAALAALFSLACLPRPAFAAAQLSALYLWWESRLYPALLRLLAVPALPGAGTPAPAAGAVKSGRISSDETWSGRVAVADYLTIEAGARVTLLPGTEVVFERREPWFFPVLRAGYGGEKLELESAGSKLLVYGELDARGTSSAPVLFGGPAFAGLHALGAGKLRLENCALAGSSACAVSARDSAEVQAVSCAVSAGARGAELYGAARAVLRDCSFSGCAGPALLAGDHASVLVYGGRAASCGGASAELRGCAAAGFYGFGAAACASGFILCGKASARLENCSVTGSGGRAAVCLDRAALRASGCSFEGNPAGLKASGRTVSSFVSCAFSAEGGPPAQFCGSNAASFSGVSFTGGRGPSLLASGHNSISLDGCSFAGGESAADFTGRGRLRAARSSFSGTAGAALRVRRAASFSAEGCRVEGCKAGLRAEDCAELSLTDTVIGGCAGPGAAVTGRGLVSALRSSFSGNGVGLHLSGELSASLSACTFDGQAGAPLILDGRARCAVDKTVFSGNGSGAALCGAASAEVARCAFSANAGPSFELSGEASLDAGETSSSGAPALLMAGTASAAFSRCRAESPAAPAVSLSGKSFLRASGSLFKSGGDAVYCRGGASADLHGCALAAGAGAALDFGGRQARLRAVTASGAGGLLVTGPARLRADGLEIKALDYAVDSSGGRLRFSGLRSEGGRRGGILLKGGSARLSLAEISGAPYPGLAAEGGARLRCSGVVVSGRPWSLPPAAPARAVLRPALAAFAAATARLPLFSAVYRAVYLAGARAAGLLLRPATGGSVYLYRGMAAPGWVAGLSDMDLALLLPPLSPDGDWRAFSGVSRRLRAFRALFPFTGEALLAPAADFASFISGWGLKGAEFRAASRLLSGPPLPPPVERPGRAADLTEAFYSYTLLLTHFRDTGLPPAFRVRNCLKGLADVKRYLDPDSPVRASRSAYAAAAGLTPEACPPDEAAFRAFSALHAASPAAPPGLPAPAAEGGWFNAHAFAAACARLREEAGADLGVALDSLYRVYLVLPDEAAVDKQAFLRAAGALGAAAGGYFSAAPLILTRFSFAALAVLPYLNNPVFPRDLAAAPRGGSPEDGGVYCWNLRIPAAAPGAAPGAAALAARHFAASWRSLWGQMPPHYFYTRAAGLRLILETGSCPPFADPAALGEESRALARGGPGWEEFSAGGAGRSNFEFISAQTAALAEAARGR